MDDGLDIYNLVSSDMPLETKLERFLKTRRSR